MLWGDFFKYSSSISECVRKTGLFVLYFNLFFPSFFPLFIHMYLLYLKKKKKSMLSIHFFILLYLFLSQFISTSIHLCLWRKPNFTVYEKCIWYIYMENERRKKKNQENKRKKKIEQMEKLLVFSFKLLFQLCIWCIEFYFEYMYFLILFYLFIFSTNGCIIFCIK